jgi:hypothetical protein
MEGMMTARVSTLKGVGDLDLDLDLSIVLF